jgi:hypothetical protein
MRIGSHVEIDHGIGDAVAHFVGVTLRHRLAAEEIVSTVRHLTLYMNPTVEDGTAVPRRLNTRRGVAVKPPDDA